MKNVISVETLKENVKVYLRLEEENSNGWEWFYTCALPDLLQDKNITLKYVRQMTKEELDVTISLSLDIVKKFQSLDLAQAFLDVYTKYYGQGLDEENFFQNEIQPLMKFIEQNKGQN